jgi:Kdo2-lipid IVA lauroyltransferase/acyltransferase
MGTAIRFQLERFLFWIILVIARLIPLNLFLKMGRGFGVIAFHLDRRHRFIALQNFRVAFPDAPARQALNTIRNCYAFFGMYLFDMLASLKGVTPERMRSFEFEGLEHLDLGYARKKGVLIYAAHWGAWEMNAVVHGFLGYPLSVVTRKLDNPYLEDLLEKFRTSTGNGVIKKTDGYRPMLRTLNEGRGIAVVMDQNVTTEERIFVDFFGKPASTTPAVALLKLKTDAALIPAFGLPLPGGRYRFIYGEPVDIPLTGDREQDVLAITKECTNVIERMIRKYPEYWLWMHRRWKTRPETNPEISKDIVEKAIKT